MFKQNDNGQLVYRQNGRIRGFIVPLENAKYAYSFGKPSQSQYICFECSDLMTAKRKFLNVVEVSNASEVAAQ